jgi:hypothetical protein
MNLHCHWKYMNILKTKVPKYGNTQIGTLPAEIMKQISFPILSLLLVACYSCGPSTKISGTWTNPDAIGKAYNKIVVLALTDNIQAKQNVENTLQNQLKQEGIQTAKSMDMFPPDFKDAKLTHEQILQKVGESNYEAVLTVSLLDTKTETRYVPGTGAMGYAPFGYGYYGSFGGYYNYMFPMTYSPGYYTQDKIYYIETNLYDALTEKLVWSAQSETYNPSDLVSFSKGFAKVTVDKMKAEGVLRKSGSFASE